MAKKKHRALGEVPLRHGQIAKGAGPNPVYRDKVDAVREEIIRCLDRRSLRR